MPGRWLPAREWPARPLVLMAMVAEHCIDSGLPHVLGHNKKTENILLTPRPDRRLGRQAEHT